MRVEEIPTDRSTIRLWVLLLAGPVLWISHFMAVYLYAEAACVGGPSHAIVPVVVIATIVAAVVTTWTTWLSWRAARRGEGDEAIMGWAGTLLGALSVLAILMVGLPALAVEVC